MPRAKAKTKSNRLKYVPSDDVECEYEEVVFRKVPREDYFYDGTNYISHIVYQPEYSTEYDTFSDGIISRDEYRDIENVLKTIKKYYIGYVDGDEWRMNDCEFVEKYEGNYYYIEEKCYIDRIGGWDYKGYCNRKYECPPDQVIDSRYHMYDDKTGKWIHIKRLPDIRSNLRRLGNFRVQEIIGKKHYVLDNKFYWKYVYENDDIIWIKFYPNLHNDIKYLIEKGRKKFSQKVQVMNEVRSNQLFYLFYNLPVEIQNIILKYIT